MLIRSSSSIISSNGGGSKPQQQQQHGGTGGMGLPKGFKIPRNNSNIKQETETATSSYQRLSFQQKQNSFSSVSIVSFFSLCHHQ